MRAMYSMLVLAALLAAAYSQTDSFMNQGAIRSYILYVPSGVANPPLLINMHGLGSNATQQRLLTGFDAIANREKFIMVYPDGVSNQWDVTGNRDVNFISALIDTIRAHHPLDLNRIYSTGMSMGGYMSYRLACALGNRIAAIGSVSGLNVSFTCAPPRAVPVLHIHGTADTIVNYGGVAATVSGWVTRDGCPATPVTSDPYPASNPSSVVKKDYYGLCRDSSEVVLLTVKGGGHNWPGANWGGATMDINASEEIWAFLKGHHLGRGSAARQPNAGRLPRRPPAMQRRGNELVISSQTEPRVLDLQGRRVALSMHLGSGGESIIDIRNQAHGVCIIAIPDMAAKRIALPPD